MKERVVNKKVMRVVIASSRQVLNGDAYWQYCVVFKNWAQTSCFLSDPFTAFDSRFRVSHSVSQTAPALLADESFKGMCPFVDLLL
jgi:hypothetical protein